MKTKILVLPALAVGAAAALLMPQETEAYNLLGGSLAQNQRYFKVFNNFTDASANNNSVAHVNFPGYTGAVMAIWKGCIEWQSQLHANGQGDPYQGNLLGSGGANFDPMFMGEATGVGGTNDNTHSELALNGGGTFAFAETPISDGWRIRYYQDPWFWKDGPGNEGAADLQGIAAHEYGHALGLDHSGVPGATMQPSSATGIEQRSIAADDIAGVQAIYGVASGTKPRITGVSVATGVATITGTNFNPTSGNNVWFTKGSSNGTGAGGTVVVSNLGTTGGGGTEILVGIPGNAGPGDVMIRTGSGNAGLSNAWPINPAGAPGGGITISSLSPTSLPAVTVDGAPNVSVFGSGFFDTTSVTVDGILLSNFPAEYSILSDSQISIFTWPLVTQLGPVEVTVNGTTGSDTALMTITENFPPVFNLVGSQSEGGFLFSATGLQFQCASGEGDVHFLAFSGQNTPSVLPGFVSFSIGNNFFNLFGLGSYTPTDAGYIDVNLPVSGSLSGLIIYLQSAVLDVSSGIVFPLVMTNTQSGQFLF